MPKEHSYLKSRINNGLIYINQHEWKYHMKIFFETKETLYK